MLKEVWVFASQKDSPLILLKQFPIATLILIVLTLYLAISFELILLFSNASLPITEVTINPTGINPLSYVSQSFLVFQFSSDYQDQLAVVFLFLLRFLLEFFLGSPSLFLLRISFISCFPQISFIALLALIFNWRKSLWTLIMFSSFFTEWASWDNPYFADEEVFLWPFSIASFFPS